MKNRVLILGGVALSILLAIQTYRLEVSSKRYEALHGEFERYRLNQKLYNAEQEKKMNSAMEEIRNEAKKQNEQIKNEIDAAHALALNHSNRLYEQQLARLRAACNTSSTTGGTDANDPIGVLADVLTRTDEASGIYARVADERGVALRACIAAYQAIEHKNE